MKTATVKELKDQLNKCSHKELLEICLRLSKFKKENKELLSYLLFEAADEASYIEGIKNEMDEQFELINKKNYFFIKKSIRKILRGLRNYIRYSKKQETEAELLIYFCVKLRALRPSIGANLVLKNLYNRQVESIRKKVAKLHEDLQYDFEVELEELRLYA